MGAFWDQTGWFWTLNYHSDNMRDGQFKINRCVVFYYHFFLLIQCNGFKWSKTEWLVLKFRSLTSEHQIGDFWTLQSGSVFVGQQIYLVCHGAHYIHSVSMGVQPHVSGGVCLMCLFIASFLSRPIYSLWSFQRVTFQKVLLVMVVKHVPSVSHRRLSLPCGNGGTWTVPCIEKSSQLGRFLLSSVEWVVHAWNTAVVATPVPLIPFMWLHGSLWVCDWLCFMRMICQYFKMFFSFYWRYKCLNT